MDAKQTDPPRCPICRSDRTEHTNGDKWRCQSCARVLRLVYTGRFVPFVDWVTAGRAGR